MSINFATLQGLTIPEGVVTQIAKDGVVLWMLAGNKIILEVEKFTSNTYAAETTYENEEFILLDIYPKTNGTVSVTYGGLTKTITDTSGAEEPNAQQVFFGTFNDVSDSVVTPASGELTIDGDCRGVAIGIFASSSKVNNNRCRCVTAITSLGEIEFLADLAFFNCTDITSVELPNSVISIGDSAFYGCESLISCVLPTQLELIDAMAFYNTSLVDVEIPSSVQSIGERAFHCNAGNTNGPSLLKTVKMLSTTPPELVNTTKSDGTILWSNFGDLTVEGCALEQIIVPTGCSAAYKAAEGWSTYANYIVEA